MDAIEEHRGGSFEPVLRRTILLAFNPEITTEQVSAVEHAFHALSRNSTAIADLEWGSAVSASGEYTHCLMISFRTAADLEDYNNHPEHQAIAQRYGSWVRRDLVFDYWVKGASAA